MVTPVNKIIGERLKARMASLGVSSAELAKRAQVKPSFIYDIVNGKSTNPSIVKLAQVADQLGISISFLIDGAGEVSLQSPANMNKTSFFSPEDYVAIAPIGVSRQDAVGHIVVTEETPSLLFSKEWVHAQLGVAPEVLRIYTVQGDHMEPTLQAGDTLMIDTTKQQATPPGIFVIFDGFGLTAKRLEMVQGASEPTLRLISDNSRYSSYLHSLRDVQVVGRVVWSCRKG